MAASGARHTLVVNSAHVHVERAAAGLVIALFLAAALLVGYILFRVSHDYEARTAPLEKATSQVVRLNPHALSDLMQRS